MTRSKDVEKASATQDDSAADKNDLWPQISAIFEQRVKESEDDRAAIFCWITSDREVVDLTPPYYSQEQLKVLAEAGVFDEMKDPEVRILAHADPDLPQIMFTFEINMRVLWALATGVVPVGIGTLFAARFVDRLCKRITDNLADALGDKLSEAALKRVGVLKVAIQERIREADSAQEDGEE
ncbi:MAG: hypothetical protein J4F98_13750 [Acidobacteria bacterium]|nr:hypothetical protein [Acidobacteriota bacterium]